MAGMADAGAEIPQDQQAMMMFQGIWGIATSVIATICGIVIIIGSVKMMRLQSYGFAMTACILATAPHHLSLLLPGAADWHLGNRCAV